MTDHRETPRQGMSRRELLRLMGISAVGTALAACTPVAAPTTGGTAQEATAGAPAQETVTIRFWNHWLAARVELIDQIIANFEEEHPNIEVENLAQPWERREENMFTAMASNDPPEVVMATRAEILQLADDGLIAPIDDYVDEAGLDLDRFYPAEINNMRWEGNLYSMPMPTGGGITGIMLVNVDMFETEGAEVVVPETWQELEDLAREYTVLDERGIVSIVANVSGADVGGFASNFFAWLYTNNGRIYSDDLKSVAFNSPEGVETLTWIVDFTNEINGGIQNVIDFFITGQEANEAQPWYNDVQLVNFPNVSIFFHMATFAPDLQWDMGLRPYNSDNPDAESHGISGEQFGWGYVIPEAVTGAERQAAFQWVKKITYDMDGACWFMQEQSRPSPIKECNEDQMYYDVNPKWDLVQESLERDISVDILPVHTQVRDIVGQAVQAALFGEKSPEEALNDATEQAQVIVDTYWSERE